MRRIVGLVLCVLVAATAYGGELNFSRIVGDIPFSPVKENEVTTVPYITWGGDVVTFHANGGIETKEGSIYNRQGLKLKLVAGDDFVGQVKAYCAGDTPYLRCTSTMLGLCSEVIGKNPATKPVVIMQLTWSAGDHIIAREQIKNLDNWKKKKVKVCLQQNGPHVGLVDDALRAAGLRWSDIDVVWAKDLTGSQNCPAAMFRADQSIDCCCCISPDMIGLCGGLDQKGGEAEGAVLNSHVVLSTAQMSRSISDWYVVRSDYYQAHRAEVEKFVAGYLQGAAEIVAAKKQYNDGKGKSEVYVNALTLAQSIYGKDVLKTTEVDAHGLMCDCNIVGLPGNMEFFDDAGNPNGFIAKQKVALDVANTLGVATGRYGFERTSSDWQKIAQLAGLPYALPSFTGGRIQGEIEHFTDDLDKNTILTFTIKFQPNQTDFSADTYGAEFERVVRTASTAGNAVFAVRGHADVTAVIKSFLRAGKEKGIITVTGSTGNYRYFLRGQPLDLSQTNTLLDEIRNGNFVGASEDPNEVMQAAVNLSLARAQAVKEAIVKYAKASGLNLDASQIRPQGIGVREPVIARPTNITEAKENMRVEFRLVKVPAEAIKSSDFDY